MLASRYREQNADGSDPKRLTDTPNSDTEPAYAPNGTLAIRRTWYQPALGRQITLLDESGNALPVFNPRPEGHKPRGRPTESGSRTSEPACSATKRGWSSRCRVTRRAS